MNTTYVYLKSEIFDKYMYTYQIIYVYLHDKYMYTYYYLELYRILKSYYKSKIIFKLLIIVLPTLNLVSKICNNILELEITIDDLVYYLT